MKKRFISADELLIDSFKLADQIFQSGFQPHFIVGVWRGGAPVGIAVQEYLDYRGVETDHIAIRTSSYHSIKRAILKAVILKMVKLQPLRDLKRLIKISVKMDGRE